MSEDIANIEADIETLFAALELAGVAADRARRDAVRLARWVSQNPPRTRAEWEQRAQLRDGQGKELGYLDTSKARRIDLGDTSGAGDRDVPAQKPADPAPTSAEQGPRPLVEIEGQFFEVTGSKGPGAPEQVRPISSQEAQARIQEHRPDLSTRMVGETDARLEVTRGQRPSTASTQGVAPAPAAGSPAASRAQDPEAAVRPGVMATPETVSDAQGQSAAEAFGASDMAKPGRGRAKEAPNGDAPSTAELVATGARSAGAAAHR